MHFIRRQPLFRISFLVLAILFFGGHAATAQEQDYPTIPYSALKPYKASTVEEKLEAMRMTRLRLDGPISILSDPLEGHISTGTEGKSSARFELRNAPQFTVEILTFPHADFEYELNDQILNLYLKGLSLQYKPEQNYQILEEAAFTTVGPAKFRILGQRAHSFRYSYQDEEQTIVYGENWIERDSYIHIVRICAPQRGFDLHFREVKAALNSMAEIE